MTRRHDFPYAAAGHPLARTVFGPIMLITLGSLFAVEYNGGPSVSRTWPVLIIVAGLLKLAVFASSRQQADWDHQYVQPPYTPPVNAGGPQSTVSPAAPSEPGKPGDTVL